MNSDPATIRGRPRSAIARIALTAHEVQRHARVGRARAVRPRNSRKCESFRGWLDACNTSTSRSHLVTASPGPTRSCRRAWVTVRTQRAQKRGEIFGKLGGGRTCRRPIVPRGRDELVRRGLKFFAGVVGRRDRRCARGARGLTPPTGSGGPPKTRRWPGRSLDHPREQGSYARASPEEPRIFADSRHCRRVASDPG